MQFILIQESGSTAPRLPASVTPSARPPSSSPSSVSCLTPPPSNTRGVSCWPGSLRATATRPTPTCTPSTAGMWRTGHFYHNDISVNKSRGHLIFVYNYNTIKIYIFFCSGAVLERQCSTFASSRAPPSTSTWPRGS